MGLKAATLYTVCVFRDNSEIALDYPPRLFWALRLLNGISEPFASVTEIAKKHARDWSYTTSKLTLRKA